MNPASSFRTCIASSSHIQLPPYARSLSLLTHSHSPTPFFTSPPAPGKHGGGNKYEEEVDDREFGLRVGKATMHLRDSLPHLFNPAGLDHDMFPPDVYSRNVVLRLPPPLPLKISSLQAYSMAFSIARNGMHAFHSDLHITLNKLAINPNPTPSTSPAAVLTRRPLPTHRYKQIRVLLSAHGTPRLPPHKEATWQTSSLYTLSPYSGLITTHEVETIRPLPGEGVAEWLMQRLLGWTSRQREGEMIPCPDRMVRAKQCGDAGSRTVR